MHDATQAWFWTPGWQAGERNADADLDAGRVETFTDDDEFLTALKTSPSDRSQPPSQ